MIWNIVVLSRQTCALSCQNNILCEANNDNNKRGDLNKNTSSSRGIGFWRRSITFPSRIPSWAASTRNELALVIVRWSSSRRTLRLRGSLFESRKNLSILSLFESGKNLSILGAMISYSFLVRVAVRSHLVIPDWTDPFCLVVFCFIWSQTVIGIIWSASRRLSAKAGSDYHMLSLPGSSFAMGRLDIGPSSCLVFWNIFHSLLHVLHVVVAVLMIAALAVILIGLMVLIASEGCFSDVIPFRGMLQRRMGTI